jgi:hypothetical protein
VEIPDNRCAVSGMTKQGAETRARTALEPG